MLVSSQIVHEALVIRFRVKSIDSSCGKEVDNLVREIIAGNSGKIIFDFTEVQFVTSYGISIILQSMKRIKASGGDFRVANINSEVENVLSITKIKDLLDIYDSVDDAVK